MNRGVMLTSLQRFMQQRDADVTSLTAAPMVALMLDWYRLVPLDGIAAGAPGDTLVFRYGGWSEGCATGFRISVMRRIALPASGGEGDGVAVVGTTLLFDPARFGDIPSLSISSADWRSLEAFQAAIESAPGYRASAGDKPLQAVLETDTLR